MQLIIHTKGAYLKRHQNMFEVRIEEVTRRIAPQEVEIIFLSTGTLVTTDALMLALQKEIEVVFIDHAGTAKGRVWNNTFGSTPKIRRNQAFFHNHHKIIEWLRQTLCEKITNQKNLLIQIAYSGNLINGDTTFSRLQDSIKQLEESLVAFENINTWKMPRKDQTWKDQFRGLEGNASRIYFSALGYVLPHKYQFRERTRPALDKFNCLLNYGYGMLYPIVQGALIQVGLDPALGILHADQYGQVPTLAFDLIERYRIWVDTVVVRLCIRDAFDEGHFRPNPEGEGIWLQTDGKRILVQQLHEYFQEIVPKNKVNRTRLAHIRLEAQALAQLFLKLSEKK
ncbi:CRISPR-associated endonuclease Cas1 [Hugenholtzia roseola]|uniref:CRISPR-associated endonuclease Cas1 n=1 Tax=Hugenholtzia roseola TaxID=1002 RepID=UPI00041AE7DA|nr:CRISPR-associated endonuclease Cas1 [Hugenholtzia roseola]